MERNSRLLKSLSYHGVLDRGFAVIRDDENSPISGISNVKTGSSLSVEMRDGNLWVVAGPGLKKGSIKSRDSKPDDQGKLF